MNRPAIAYLLRIFTLAALVSLVACASHDDPLLTAPLKFKTIIYDNGIKQFELKIIYDYPKDQKPQIDSLHGKQMSDINQKKTEATLVKRLETKLQETHYCRKGYILSKEFSTLSLGDLLIKGECVEGASVEDKRLFPNE